VPGGDPKIGEHPPREVLGVGLGGLEAGHCLPDRQHARLLLNYLTKTSRMAWDWPLANVMVTWVGQTSEHGVRARAPDGTRNPTGTAPPSSEPRS
jgi:hypothetical protein